MWMVEWLLYQATCVDDNLGGSMLVREGVFVSTGEVLSTVNQELGSTEARVQVIECHRVTQSMSFSIVFVSPTPL